MALLFWEYCENRLPCAIIAAEVNKVIGSHAKKLQLNIGFSNQYFENAKYVFLLLCSTPSDKVIIKFSTLTRWGNVGPCLFLMANILYNISYISHITWNPVLFHKIYKKNSEKNNSDNYPTFQL